MQQGDVPDPDTMILEGFLGRMLPPAEIRPVSRILLEHFGTVGRLFRASRRELARRAGISEAIIDEIEKTKLLLKAILQSGIGNRPVDQAHPALIEYCTFITASDRREQFHVLFLDKSKRLLVHECLQVGTVDHVTVYPREIMVLALHHDASHLVLIHNHPSGNCGPSRADIDMTNQLQEAGRLFGVSIHDHVIVGETGTFSFREKGLLTTRRRNPELHPVPSSPLPGGL